MKDFQKAPRNEPQIFSELRELCTSPGYAHALAYLCYRDNIVSFSGELAPRDIERLYSSDRLIRTEISTLIGLMITTALDLTLPTSNALQEYINRTEVLLKELHHSMSFGWLDGITPEDIVGGFNPFEQGKNLREPIFYGSESAYVFQYRDLAVDKYSLDDNWLLANKGFTIGVARDVVLGIAKFQESSLVNVLSTFKAQSRDTWTIFPGFSFSAEDISSCTGVLEDVVERVLQAFTLPANERNANFQALHDFNAANASPLISLGDKRFVLFQSYSLAEALYESPFYWMISDKAYVAEAMKHRGQFTEGFSRRRLENAFETKNIHSNVDIFESKRKKVGEIDVLVVFGNRAIILQAKSKKLTLESRKGNDKQIRDDFRKSIQDSYDQGLLCAKCLFDPKYKFVKSDLTDLSIPRDIKEVYIFCVVSDHYPALSFQARQFLKTQDTHKILSPFIMDVFTLDVMTEMLESPLRFLSYANRRATFAPRVMSGHELTTLAYHLKRNLWFDEQPDMIMLTDDFSIDLDAAMAVRREGIPGKATPEGILTRLNGTAVGRLISHIEANPAQPTLDLGFLLLSLDEKTVNNISNGINTMASRAMLDGQTHDITVAVGNSGLTIHCNDSPMIVAESSLRRHCESRKYSQRANSWYGLCLRPSAEIRFGLNLEYEWKQDKGMDARMSLFPKATRFKDFGKLGIAKSMKIGRNAPCPCGSGKKYKKCHDQ